MKKYSNSIIDGSLKHIRDMQMIATDNKKLSQSIFNLCIINYVLEWTKSFSSTYENVKKSLMVLMDRIILQNQDIPTAYENINDSYTMDGRRIIEINSNKIYKNVNTPQTTFYWQNINLMEDCRVAKQSEIKPITEK